MGSLPAYPVSFLGIHSFNLLLSGVVQDETYLEHQVKTLTGSQDIPGSPSLARDIISWHYLG